MRKGSLAAATVLVAAASGHAPAAYAGGAVSTPISGLLSPTDLASADFDGNGRADLAIADARGLSVQLNQAGVFAGRVLAQSGPGDAVATGDLDHDGRPDVATLARAQRAVDLNVQDAAGGWTTRSLANVAVDPAAIAVGDLNGDGWGDIAVTDAGVDAGGDYTLRLFIRDPLSTDYDETTLTNFHDAGKGGAPAVAIGDLDGDGRMDLATANGDNADTVTRFIQQVDGSYERRPLSFSRHRRAVAIAIGDLGGVGPGADVAVGYGAGEPDAIGVYRRPGSFAYFIGQAAGTDAVAAIRVDGRPALAATSRQPGHNVTVLSGTGLQLPELFGTAATARALASGDFDGDGLTDLATLHPADGKALLVTRLSPPIQYSTCGTLASIARRVRCSYVPPTLSLELDQRPLSFGTFTPGLTKDYTATANARVDSTVSSAALTVSDPGKLTNGSATLDSPLAVSFSKSAWAQPTADDPVTITFKQHIDGRETLRAGAYSRTVTFTLAPTEP